MKRQAEELTTPVASPRWLPRDLITQIILTQFDHTLVDLDQCSALFTLRLVAKEWTAAINATLLQQLRCIDYHALNLILFYTQEPVFGVARTRNAANTVVHLFGTCCATLIISRSFVTEWITTVVPLLPALRTLVLDTPGMWPGAWNAPNALAQVRRLCITNIDAASHITLPPQLETLWFLAQRHFIGAPLVTRKEINAHPTLRHYIGPVDQSGLASKTLVYTRCVVQIRGPCWKRSSQLSARRAINKFITGCNEAGK